jgi:hypothetical protein
MPQSENNPNAYLTLKLINYEIVIEQNTIQWLEKRTMATCNSLNAFQNISKQVLYKTQK